MMNNQKGTALVEVLIATAIAGLIVGLPGIAIYQFFAITERGSSIMTALSNVQNAGFWVTRDGQMASTATVNNGLELILSDNSSVTYTLVGTGPHYMLRRTAGGSVITVARNITDVAFSVAGRVITMTITSSPVNRWGITKMETYKVYLRPTT